MQVSPVTWQEAVGASTLEEVGEMLANGGPLPHSAGSTSPAVAGLCVELLPREVLTHPVVRPRGHRATQPLIQDGGHRMKGKKPWALR